MGWIGDAGIGNTVCKKYNPVRDISPIILAYFLIAECQPGVDICIAARLYQLNSLQCSRSISKRLGRHENFCLMIKDHNRYYIGFAKLRDQGIESFFDSGKFILFCHRPASVDNQSKVERAQTVPIL